MDDLGSMEGFSQCLQSMGHGREKQTWGSNIFFFFFACLVALGLRCWAWAFFSVVNGSTRP